MAQNTLGVALRRLGRLGEAEGCCREALRLAPDYAEAHGDLCAVYLLLGERGAALEEYRRVQALNAGLADDLYRMIYKDKLLAANPR